MYLQSDTPSTAKPPILAALSLHEALLKESPTYVASVLWDQQRLVELALRQKDYAEATRRVRVVATMHPDDDIEFKLATLLAVSGDREGYAECCNELINRYAETDRPEMAERTAKVCLILPSATADLSKAVALAQKAADLDGGILPFALTTCALAAYRQGDHAAALQYLRSDSLPGESDQSFLKTIGNLVAAVAHQQLGHAEEAQQLLAQARAAIENAAKNNATYLGDWHAWLMCQILQREAVFLVEGGTAGDNAVNKNP
jgi:tetratricopeptide (TPR) repeat protein